MAGLRKQVSTQDDLNILAYWHSLRINAKGRCPLTGFYLAKRKTHTGLLCINGENTVVTSEGSAAIELKDFPMNIWKFAESAPGSSFRPKVGSKKYKEMVRFLNVHTLIRRGGQDMYAPPKGIRFGGFRSIEEAATLFKAWMDDPILFIEAVKKGSGGVKYYL